MGRGSSRKPNRSQSGGSKGSGGGRPASASPATASESAETPSETAAGPDLRKLHLWQIQGIRDLLLVALVLMLVWIGYALRAVTVPLLFGLLLAYLFEPLVARMAASKRFSRHGAVIVILATGGSALVLLGGALTPLVVTQTSQLARFVQSDEIKDAMGQLTEDAPTTPREMIASIKGIFGGGESEPEEGDEILDGVDGSGAEGADQAETEPADSESDTGPPIVADADVDAAPRPDPDPETDAITVAVDEILVARGDAPLTEQERATIVAAMGDRASVDGSDVETLAAAIAAAIEDRQAAPVAASTDGSGLGSVDYLGLVRGSFRTLGGFIGAVVGLGLVAFLIPFYFYCFSVGWPQIVQFFATLVPKRHETRIFELVGRMDTVVAGFVRGRIVISAVMGVLFAIGWWICGVPYAIPIGLIIGVFSAVPYLGGVGLPVAIGFFIFEQVTQVDGRTHAWWWIIGAPTAVFFLVQLIEGYVLTPLIAGKATNLDPVTILVAVLAGGSVLGVYGMLLAIPAAACGKILLIEMVLPRIDEWTRGERSDPLPLDH